LRGSKRLRPGKSERGKSQRNCIAIIPAVWQLVILWFSKGATNREGGVGLGFGGTSVICASGDTLGNGLTWLEMGGRFFCRYLFLDGQETAVIRGSYMGKQDERDHTSSFDRYRTGPSLEKGKMSIKKERRSQFNYRKKKRRGDVRGKKKIRSGRFVEAARGYERSGSFIVYKLETEDC